MQGNQANGYPNLTNVYRTRSKAFVDQMISQGKGMMPGFPQLNKATKESLITYLFKETPKEVEGQEIQVPNQPPYKMTGYTKFLDAEGMSAISPPWATLNAIDLNTGKYLWKIPVGDEPILAKKGIYNTGVESYGGPVITENGLLMIAATKDGKFRVFNRFNGKLLFETKLPAAGFATPSTYMAKGKQYIVIACGGTKLGTPKGNSYVAFALPSFFETRKN